ncbi:hypothetical protein J3L11_18720 [Shewanella sp. 4t3-1-2LB]|uniref:hypothetical protein n=1 Tax=Shewanella sp. 4t3-1-2LB TaxID=2817682 RepID=UPI001A994659|nr:hypothetical protein [Shewanella sp. 4t3-1-2LB]MBO1273665.1 hypothetical protein [Shewanella sp. 4t3-1-2LB]
MNYKYTPRFTPCARSIQVLKGEASTIKKSTESMSHRDSLDSVAKLYGYSNWNEIINSKNPFRDKFFAEMYSRKGKSTWKDIYKNYLKTKELTDCADSFRMFVVEHYKSFEKLGINNIARTGTRIDDDVLLQELVDHLQAKSIAGFLPQNLPSYLLNRHSAANSRI